MNAATAGRVLAVIPGLPERRSGGGVLLYELTAWLAEQTRARGTLAVVVPVPEHRREELSLLEADPAFQGVAWHGLAERRRPGVRGQIARAIGPLPADMAKVATEDNAALLERVRGDLQPTVELAVSSWALAGYREQTLGPQVRLVMVNVDPAIVRYDGPWFRRDTLVRKLACAIDRPKVRRICRRALQSAGRVAAISPADVPLLDALGGRQDTEYLPPLMRPRPLDRSAAEPGTVLITTNLGYSPNVKSLAWFLGKVWPLVAPGARLTIAGADPQGLGIGLCRGSKNARFVGSLEPAELDAAFARTAVAVNPTQTGSGFQVKLLDAVARGVPIVSTAWSNKLGSAIPASDDPEEMARLISERLESGDQATFDYPAFYADAVRAWNAFLFG